MRLTLALAAAALLAAMGVASAENPPKPDCQDAKVLSGRLISDVCWTCIFPLRVAGVTIGSAPGIPGMPASGAPEGASKNPLCSCPDPAGLPQPGVVTGLWEPARLIELVRAPGCSMSLGGIKLPMSDWRSRGTGGDGRTGNDDKVFYHYHYYAFPLLMMLDLFDLGRCNADGYVDFDLMYMSELDPTWNNDELAFFLNPESAFVANPLVQAACAADATAATLGKPVDKLFWCAGTWGNLYPLSGHNGTAGSMAKNTSLLATRATAALHRRGLARGTVGNDNLCRAKIEPMLPKTQYKMSMFFPLPETSRAHALGEVTYQWGEWRQTPGVGEDALYILWRWRDCCSVF